MIFPAEKHHFFLKMFLNAVKRLLFIYFDYLHLHLNYLQEKLKQMLSLETICLLT